MRRLALRPALSLLAFLAGLAAHAALAGDPSVGLEDQVESVEYARRHEWHKLYEAEWMSAGGAPRRVYEEVVCLRPDGTGGGRLLELPGEEAVCEERGGGVHPPDGTYERFVKEHAVWTGRNMSFVREIGTPERAQAYVVDYWLSHCQ